MYTPDGYMSAQLAKPERPNFASGDGFAGTAEDYTNEASSYIAYAGPFHVDEEKQTLTHSDVHLAVPRLDRPDTAPSGRARRRRPAPRVGLTDPIRRQDGEVAPDLE